MSRRKSDDASSRFPHVISQDLTQVLQGFFKPGSSAHLKAVHSQVRLTWAQWCLELDCPERALGDHEVFLPITHCRHFQWRDGIPRLTGAGTNHAAQGEELQRVPFLYASSPVTIPSCEWHSPVSPV